MAFEPMKRLLPTVMRTHGIAKQVESRQVVDRSLVVLRALWGEDRAKGVTAVSFKDGSLKLESVSAPALQQLKLDQTKILNALNRDLGSKVVVKIDARARGF
ncbi:MAG: DciA family protein [Patescibacteria group bacterium]|jgi:hypothetical protein